MDVRAVSSRRDLREFIELPFRLHSTSQQWVPPLRLERRMFHSRRMNGYFKHAGAQEFLALRKQGGSSRRTPPVSIEQHHGIC